MEFRDRSAAGRLLAEGLTDLRGNDVVVLGVATGGAVVAAEVAAALGVPLDVLLVRKVGVPWQPELAMGAIGEDGASLVDPVVVHAAGVEPDELAEAQDRARTELAREVAVLREVWAPVGLRGRTAIVVDDGMATGTTARVAVQVAWARGADRVILAVPVASAGSLVSLTRLVDGVVCPVRPESFRSVGQWYASFGPVGDDDLVALLRGEATVAAPRRVRYRPAAAGTGRRRGTDRAADRTGSRHRPGGAGERQWQRPVQPAQPARRRAAAG
jgi:putative phosphoribosyl transferase